MTSKEQPLSTNEPAEDVDNNEPIEIAQTRHAEKDSSQKSLKWGSLFVVLLIISSLLWYLFADRYTPYTQQARIDGYVVGISSEVSGVLKHIWVKNNEVIQAGQKLFEVERSQYEIALNKAQSDLEDMKRQIAAGTASIESAQSNLVAAKANKNKSGQDVHRLEELYKKDPGAISVRRLESSRSSYAQALAKVSGAEAEVVRAMEQQGGDGDNNAKLKSVTSAVNKVKLDLKHTITYAASAGIISDLRTDIGMFAAAGSPLMTFISIHDVWIEAQFTENNLGHLKAGSLVELVIDSLPGEVFSGTVRSIGLGVAVGQTPPAGTLPTIDNNRDWLRQSQRFPVIVSFDLKQSEDLKHFVRIGGQAEVIAFTEGHHFLNALAKLYIRLMSYFSYAY